MALNLELVAREGAVHPGWGVEVVAVRERVVVAVLGQGRPQVPEGEVGVHGPDLRKYRWVM